MGPYTEIIRSIGSSLHWDDLTPPKLTQPDIDLGARYMDELMCLPAKATLGTLVRACEQGADTLLIFNSCGQCRLKAYWILQQRALRKMGYQARVQPITLGRHTVHDLRMVDPSISYWKGWLVFYRILRQLWKFDQGFWKQFHIDGGPKIGIVGEIYTILEDAINCNLMKKLNKLGASVHNSLPLSYFIFKGFHDRGWLKRPGMDMSILKKAHSIAHHYFPIDDFGGHGKESVIHTIYYGLMSFDGVIHVLPFPCAPESTVAPILSDISNDFSIPLLKLIFDTQTGEAGLVTRLEAFVDMLKRKRNV